MSANANGAQDTEAIQQSTIADGSASIAPADIQWQAPEPGIGADRHQNHCYQEHEAMSLRAQGLWGIEVACSSSVLDILGVPAECSRSVSKCKGESRRYSIVIRAFRSANQRAS